jgi:cAMP phosphodiesterase
VKIHLLPSTFEESGAVSVRQHLASLVIDDLVAFDAGSLAMAASAQQKASIRNIVLSHAHLDHVAGLPLFIDDLFATLEQPVKVHATSEVIDALESHVFNWVIYPRFSELKNKNGDVLVYKKIESGKEFRVEHLSVLCVPVNHKVPASGFIIADGETKIAISGDTAEADLFWETVNSEGGLDAVFVECAFPDALTDLAEASHHLTPKKLKKELQKLKIGDCPIYVINIKPMYRDVVVRELSALAYPNLSVFPVGKTVTI